MTTSSWLIAGAGNVFLGDDAFGVEVVRALRERALPPEVELIDFGVRSWDLFAALARFARVLLIDAHSSGQPPGSLRLFEPGAPLEAATLSEAAHSLKPHDLLAQLASNAAALPRVQVLGCEPESFGDPELGRVGLSAPVQAAVPLAVELVLELLARERDHA